MPTVLTVGTFDILHPGHVFTLRQAKRLGDRLVVLVSSDRIAESLRGVRPLHFQAERMERLRGLGLADEIVAGSPDRQKVYEVLDQVRPDAVALGYDQSAFVPGLRRELDQRGLTQTKIVRLEELPGFHFSSSKVRSALVDPQAGFLIVDKPMDWTSHDVVAKARRIAKQRAVGHAGTLDPFATGVLILGFGKATKLLDAVHLFRKVYRATVRLGVVSDTYDRTGAVRTDVRSTADGANPYPLPLVGGRGVRFDQFGEGAIEPPNPPAGGAAQEDAPWDRKEKASNVEAPSRAVVELAIRKFIGQIEQIVPPYSAKKLAGHKLYELARRGIAVEPPKQLVTIHRIDLISYEYPTLEFEVECSSGTYIRSLANELGLKLGCGAVLWELRRTSIGPFAVDRAVTLEQLEKDGWDKHRVAVQEVMDELIDWAMRN